MDQLQQQVQVLRSKNFRLVPDAPEAPEAQNPEETGDKRCGSEVLPPDHNNQLEESTMGNQQQQTTESTGNKKHQVHGDGSHTEPTDPMNNLLRGMDRSADALNRMCDQNDQRTSLKTQALDVGKNALGVAFGYGIAVGAFKLANWAFGAKAVVDAPILKK